MTIDLRRLHYFVATVEAGSATRAAATLHVTQPVLSRQLQLLQKDVGLRLFRRDGRNLRLTHAGDAYLAEARRLLHEAEQLERTATSLAAGRIEQLHLAVPTTTLTDVLAPFIATLAADDPVPVLRGLDPRGAAAAIADGADLAIVHRPPPRELASRPLAVLPVWAQLPADDPLATSGALDVADLAARPLVLLTEDFRPRNLLDRAMESADLVCSQILECTNAQVAQALAAAGRGIAVVSDDPRFELVGLPITGPSGPVNLRLYAAWNHDHHAADTLAALAERLAGFCVDRYGPGVAPDFGLTSSGRSASTPPAATRRRGRASTGRRR